MGGGVSGSGGMGAAGSWQRVPGAMGGSTPGTVGRATPSGRLWAEPVGNLQGGFSHGRSPYGEGSVVASGSVARGDMTPQSGGRGGGYPGSRRSPMDAYDEGAAAHDQGSGPFEPPERSLEDEDDGPEGDDASPSIFGSGGMRPGKVSTPPSGRSHGAPSPGGSASTLGRGARGGEGLGTWVKIWGFERQLRAAIVRELQRLGDVVDWVDGKGNWTFVRFGDAVGARKALGRSGSTFLNGVIVGVSEASPEDIDRVRPDSIPSSSERARSMPDGMASFTPSPWTRRVHFAPGDALATERGAVTPSSGRQDPAASTFSHIERLRRPAVPRPAGGLWAHIREYILGI